MENKRYRLIKEYPSSPKLETVITPWKNNLAWWKYKDENGATASFPLRPEQHPEYWQELTLLFTTEDGKDIYTGDAYCIVKRNLKSGLFISDCIAQNHITYELKIKRFSTEEMAEQYINKLRKPLLKTLDGKKIYQGDKCFAVDKEFKGIIGPCYFDGTDDKLWYFSTKEKSEKWIKDNKPMYSRKQVLNILMKLQEDLNPFGILINYIEYLPEQK